MNQTLFKRDMFTSVPHSNLDDTSRQHIVSNNNEPERSYFDGTGDLDAFFTQLEILVRAYY